MVTFVWSKGYRFTSPLSPCPGFSKWSLSSRRTYRLSPLWGSINSASIPCCLLLFDCSGLNS